MIETETLKSKTELGMDHFAKPLVAGVAASYEETVLLAHHFLVWVRVRWADPGAGVDALARSAAVADQASFPNQSLNADGR